MLSQYAVRTSQVRFFPRRGAPTPIPTWFAISTIFGRIAPEDNRLYRHTAEGPDDMPAHIRAALTQTSLTIPVMNGRPALGTWQGIYLFEHRSAPHRRSVVLHVSA